MLSTISSSFFMGQSSSTAGASSGPNCWDISSGNRSAVVSVPSRSNVRVDFFENVRSVDDIASLPDDCLAEIFRFLDGVDRKRCSLVSKRWLRVEGESRSRLSLNAQAEILDFIPSIFTRFDSVTKLALRCDRKCASINDEALILISFRCRNLSRLKLRSCREITAVGMAGLAKNCQNLKKLSCSSCMFGAQGMNALLENCASLEELSLKRLRGVCDGTQLVNPGMAGSSLKSICLKELIHGQSFRPLITGSKKLKTFKLNRCLGDWDGVMESIGNVNNGLTEIHLEKIQVSDVGLSGISKCLSLESLHIVKTPECSNDGLVSVAQSCKLLRKLHVDGWSTDSINDEGLLAVAKHCLNLQELVLIGIYPTSLSLAAIATNCKRLERLALCGIATIGDADIASIAEKCVALRKLCIKGCPISNNGIKELAWGCPNLVKVKVKKCRKVTSEIVVWLLERRRDLAINFDESEFQTFDGSGSGSDVGGDDRSDFTTLIAQIPVNDAPSTSSNNNRLTMFRTKFGFFTGRNFVLYPFRRGSNNAQVSDSDVW